MGFFNRLLGAAAGAGGSPSCPDCGAPLDGEGLIDDSYWCEGCGRIVLLHGGELVVAAPGDALLMRQGPLGLHR